jgi:protein phosphatase
MLRVADHVALTDTGRQRRGNEDASFARPPLFVVADGMGGAQAGEVASRTAVELFAAGLPDGDGSVEERLAALVAEANARIHALATADADRAGMGTTLTAAYVGERDVAVAHVGDSRLYLWRDGALEQRTDDHSLVGELVRRGQLSPEEAEDHPQRSIITRALGPEGDVAVDHHSSPARDGDVFLLCSDGLTSMVPDETIAKVLATTRSLRVAARDLVRAANDAGGRDNITVVLFRVEDVGGPGDAATGRHAAVAPRDPAGDDPAHTTIVRPGDRGATATAVRRPRDPRPAAAQVPERRGRGRLRGALRSLTVVLVVLAVLGLPAYFASQSVYWLGTDEQGFVTLYRGVPYELPAGLDLYAESFVSGVPTTTLPRATQDAVAAHELRSFEDARDLIRRIERGELVAE